MGKGTGKGKGGKSKGGAPKGGASKGGAPEGGTSNDKDAEDNLKGASASTKALVETLRAFSSPQWWTIGHDEKVDSTAAAQQKRMKPDVFKQQCEVKHAEMTQVYENAMANDSEQRWLRKVSSEGTAGDRVASLTMLIQVCPVFSTRYIKSLLGMASKMGRGDSMMALDGLKDLFIGTLLPDRKLKTLSQAQPAAKGIDKAGLTKACVVAYFEDYLKTAFAAFVQILSQAAHNTVVFFKTKAIRTIYELLAAKPEQERALLGLLVNKFGDLAPKVSSNVSFHLKKLVDSHPGMKLVIAKDIETFLARPNITQKSKYFAILFLSELKLLRAHDKELASRLIHLFVTQLEDALKPQPSKKSDPSRKRRFKKLHKSVLRRGLHEDDNRIIRTLINGVQRVIPYMDSTVAGSPVQIETVDTLFKICHTVSSFSTRIAIMSLLFKILIKSGDLPDRFYRLLFEQLLQFDLFQSTHRLQAYLLLKKCVPVDASINRGVALMRRMLQVGANAEPAVATVGLAIMKEMFVARRTEMKQLVQSVDSNLRLKDADLGDDAEEERFVDDDAVVSKAEGGAESEYYNPLAREPRHAKARQTALWELFALASHVHPFVSHGATQLLAAETYTDVGENPFQDFATSELLEQFAYASSHPRTKKGEKGAVRLPYNSDKFVKKKNIAPHEKFFHLYFSDSAIQEQQKRKAARRKQSEDDFDEEGQDANDDEEDQFFDDYLKEQMPKGDFDCDPDADDDSDDIDMDMDMDDDEDEDVDNEDMEGPGGSDDDDDGDSAVDESSDADASSGTGRKGKRQADEANLPRKDRVKKLKKKHSGSMFASVEDFEQLLQEDFG